MNTALRGFTAFTVAGTLATLQYFVEHPWRYLLTSGEFIALFVLVAILWGKTKNLVQTTEEHQARLDAIATVADKAKVVHDANTFVDAVYASLYVHETREPVDSSE